MGKNVTLGRACALVAVALMGPNIPLEEAGHEERLRIFKSAAYYALTDEELEEILETEVADINHISKNLLVEDRLGHFQSQMLLNNWILACSAEYNVLKFLSCCLRPHILKQAALSLNKSSDILHM